jgi:3-deoxy-7-phosphoheptulonate synthase
MIGDTSAIEMPALEMQDAVERVMKVSEPFKRANRKFHPDDSLVRIGSLMAAVSRYWWRPAPVRSRVKTRCAGSQNRFRQRVPACCEGGAFKPRTSPYAFRVCAPRG